MTLTAGKRLGSYEILALIGVGGMGEVYKARDTRLERTVAIKILPDHVAHDADFRQRFEREARTISSLNHPHICTLYDVGSEDGIDFLVMELLEGETLTQRLAKGALPLPQVLRYGIEIAEALDRAHRQGVTHRDLKPGNVMVTKAGAKLLDFGLAKLKPASPVQLPSAAATAARDPFTASGTILGTLQYMAPEQVEGNAADHRADIFAFGAIVYEMATGKKAFEGASQASLIGAILKDEPRPISTLQPLSPPGFDALVATCLAKDADERWQSAADVARQLRLLQGGLSQPSVAQAGVSAASRQRDWRRGLPLALGALALGAVLSYTLTRRAPPEPRPVTRFSVPVSIRIERQLVSISADGARVAFRSADSPLIQVRELDEFATRAVPGTEDFSTTPCFSPDGQWLAYSAVGSTQLKKMPLAGGTALTLAPGLRFSQVAEADGACDWGEDGHIYFESAGPFSISRVAEAGGRVETLLDAEGAFGYRRPQLLPGGRYLLFTTRGAAPGDDRVAVLDLETREQRTLLEDAGEASYVPSTSSRTRGYLVYGLNSTLFAAPFDFSRLAVGAPRPVENGVVAVVGATSSSISRSGTLAYLASETQVFTDDSELVWVGRDGAEQPLPEPPHAYRDVQISPDGEHAAVLVFDPQAFSMNQWLYNFDEDQLTPLTFGGSNAFALWTPDSRHVIHTGADSLDVMFGVVKGQTELLYVPADRSAPQAPLLSPTARSRFYATSISFEHGVLMGSSGEIGSRNLWRLPITDESFTGAGGSAGEPLDLLATSFDEWDPMLSPDGRYVAYTSNESGRAEIYVMPYPGPGRTARISNGGGTWPRWNRNGRELFYLSAADELMVVGIETAPAFRFSTPRALFKMPAFVPDRVWPYDVAPDGRFLVRKTSASGAQQSTELRIVVNWIEELERGGSSLATQ